jgi:hypothetical protein
VEGRKDGGRWKKVRRRKEQRGGKKMKGGRVVGRNKFCEELIAYVP